MVELSNLTFKGAHLKIENFPESEADCKEKFIEAIKKKSAMSSQKSMPDTDIFVFIFLIY